MRILRLFCMVFGFSLAGLVQAQLPVSQPMPDYVLYAAQTLNARFGPIIDLNNVVWDYTNYGPRPEAASDCRNLGESLPPLPANVSVIIVELKPVRDGRWGHEIWLMLVYSDLSFVTPCQLPPTPVPSPTPPPFSTSLPPTITPPPAATFTPANCFGALPSRLTIGQEGHVMTTTGLPNNIREIPGTSGRFLGEIPPGQTFLVLDGPRCFSNYAWWLVNYNGISGWTVEGDGEEYWLEPASLMSQPTVIPTQGTIPTATPQPVVCNLNAPSRLRVGQLAQVTPGLPNNLRAAAGTGARYLGEIPPEVPFLVLAGPECASGMAWWQVSYQGTVGWTPEGEIASDYWLAPYFAEITAENASLLTRSHEIFGNDIVPLNLVAISASQFAVMDTTRTQIFVASPDAPPAVTWQAITALPFEYAALPQMSLQPDASGRFFIPQLEANTRLHIFDYPNSAPPAILETGSLTGAAIHAGLDWVAVNAGGELRLWSRSTGEQRLLTGHSAPIIQMHYSPDGRFLMTGSANEIMLWDTATWAAQQTIPQGITEQTGAGWGMGFLVLTGMNQMGIHMIDIISGQAGATLAVDETITTLTTSADGRLLAAVTAAGQLILWDMATHNQLFSTSSRAARYVSISPFNDAIFVAGTDGFIDVWGIP